MRLLFAACVVAAVFVSPGLAAGPTLEVTDAASGVAVAVQKDQRTLVCRDKAGKSLWELDVIKAAGAPAVGQPAVRHLTLQGNKLAAVYGKHSFAEIDLKSGKLLSAASDKSKDPDDVPRMQRYYPHGFHFIDAIRHDGLILWISKNVEGNAVETECRVYGGLEELKKAIVEQKIDKQSAFEVHQPAVNETLRKQANLAGEIIEYLQQSGYKKSGGVSN